MVNPEFVKRMVMGKIIFSILIFTALISCKSEDSQIEKKDGEQSSVTKYGVVSENHITVKSVVERGDVFGELLRKAGVDGNTASEVIKSSKGVFDILRINAGNSYELIYDKDSVSNGGDCRPAGGAASYMVYEKDSRSHVLFSLKDSIYTQIIEKEILRERKYAEVKINTSLWNDVTNAGASPLLALKLSDIYAWTIDFFGLQKGDSFKVIYDELSYNGEFIDVGNIFYCEFTHCGKVYKSVMYKDGEKSNLYWNEEGGSLRKAFLKAPLSFTRVSSRFTYNRLHPVYKVVRPHTGVDYAAPAGTPVMAIGDGVVISKGWSGGGGNTVKIKHNSVYTTAYLHLSRYAKGLKRGQRVSQGEVIGYVGSTGASTGPHLDFRVWKNGTPVDPLKLESPSAEPVTKGNMDNFKAQYNLYKMELDSLAVRKYVKKIIEVL